MADLAIADTGDPAPSDGRRRIMDEAATLFLRQGYDGASLRHIAAACGMQAGSLYYHFASKNEILEAVLRRGIEIMVEAFETAERASRDSAARERLGRHVRAQRPIVLRLIGRFRAAHRADASV